MLVTSFSKLQRTFLSLLPFQRKHCALLSTRHIRRAFSHLSVPKRFVGLMTYKSFYTTLAEAGAGGGLVLPCEGDIIVGLIDEDSKVYSGPTRDIVVQVYLVDSRKYDNLIRQGVNLQKILDECIVRLENDKPALVGDPAVYTTVGPMLVLPFENFGSPTMPTPVAFLRGLKVMATSVKDLPAKNLRLLLCAASSQGARYTDLEHVVSDEFMVIAAKNDKKVYPSPEDNLNVVNGLMALNIDRLKDLEGHARRHRRDLALPKELCKVTTVQDFVRLIERSARDEALQTNLLYLLNFDENTSRWDTACAHAKLGVEVNTADNRLRQYTAGDGSGAILYSCQQGLIKDLVGLLDPMASAVVHIKKRQSSHRMRVTRHLSYKHRELHCGTKPRTQAGKYLSLAIETSTTLTNWSDLPKGCWTICSLLADDCASLRVLFMKTAPGAPAEFVGRVSSLTDFSKDVNRNGRDPRHDLNCRA